jgi:hypothetical protein
MYVLLGSSLRSFLGKFCTFVHFYICTFVYFVHFVHLFLHLCLHIKGDNNQHSDFRKILLVHSTSVSIPVTDTFLLNKLNFSALEE